MSTVIHLLLILIAVVAGVSLGLTLMKHAGRTEGFDGSSCDGDDKCQPQVTAVTKLADIRKNGRRDVNDAISKTTDMPPEQQCLVNFYSLGARFVGYLGPFQGGFYDYKDATLAALKMGCRTMVLEIDYWDVPTTCCNYFPRIAVRDKAGRNVGSSTPKCDVLPSTANYPTGSSIMDICTVLAQNAFSYASPNPTDPLIVVLYLLRLPPANAPGDNSAQLTYMSNIAACLAPLLPMAVRTSAHGGNFSRQQQPGILLTNNIKDYSGKVLFFCNTDTSAFRTATGYTADIDLDYIVNLQLSYKLTQLGTTSAAPTTGSAFGILDTADSYNQIPSNQTTPIQTSTNGTWTLCMSQDPAVPVPQAMADSIQQNIGVHCVPINIWDAAYEYMFNKDHYKVHSFVPKPKPLRYIKPPVAKPATQVRSANANGGDLAEPQ